MWPGAQREGGRDDHRTTQEFSGSGIILFNTVTVGTCQNLECTTQRVNANVDCELQFIIIYQYTKYVTSIPYLKQEVNNTL